MAKKVKTTKKEKTQKPTKETKTTVSAGQKYCPKCKTTQPVANFPTDNRRKDHLYIYCRACESLRQKEKNLRRKINKAETEGIPVLKININEETGKTTETTLIPVIEA